jgi:hypothetical protein
VIRVERTVANEEFYNTLREKVAGYIGAYADYVLLVPDLFLLITRLMLDPRIDSKHKACLGAALAQADQLIGMGRLEKILAAIGIRKPQTT